MGDDIHAGQYQEGNPDRPPLVDLEAAIRDALVKTGDPEEAAFHLFQEFSVEQLLNWLGNFCIDRAEEITATEFFDGEVWVDFTLATAEQHERAAKRAEAMAALHFATADLHDEEADGFRGQQD